MITKYGIVILYTTVQHYRCRSEEEVVETARAAGLTATKGPVQVLSFTDQLNSDDLKLFELPSELLTTLEAGDT